MKEIATTGHAFVYSVLFTPNKRRIAIKELRSHYNRFMDENAIAASFTHLRRELENFRNLDTPFESPNLVLFYGHCLHEEKLLICMEFMDCSIHELYNWMHSNKHMLVEEILASVAVNVLDALICLRDQNLMHRDVKPKNILANLKGDVKLCDFGASRFFEQSLLHSEVGTLPYWSPERYGGTYDSRAEVWSLGISLAEIAYGKIPHTEHIKSREQFFNIEVENCAKFLIPDEIIEKCFADKYSQEIKVFVSSCLQPVNKRPKYDELSNMGFYKKYEKNALQSVVAKYVNQMSENLIY